MSRVRGHHEVMMPRLENVAAARSARGLLLCSGDLKEQHWHGAWLPVSNMRIALQQQKEQLQDDVCSRAAHNVVDRIPLLLNAYQTILYGLTSVRRSYCISYKCKAMALIQDHLY
ncbi:hypothetical protein PVAP13_6KG380400 [Panicum virgatum]|uniref:Uncharacterized protein n=1 Tax=Panicum virgatum TaxID=38727 RepID=A0A8T0RJM6_PANVG|nr:hypothetical protein PVAP13_6KG380400 [Panicum virgatum]